MSFSERGGAGIVAKTLYENSISQGFDCNLITVSKGDLRSAANKHPVLFLLGLIDYFIVRTSTKSILFSLYRRCSILYKSLNRKNKSTIFHLHWTPGVLSTSDVKNLYISGFKIVWTFHDMWMVTGGCHHAFDCREYESDCNGCPQSRRMFHNEVMKARKEKHELLSDCQELRVITPSRWLKDKIVQSGIDETRISVIPNPVDSKVFCPGTRATARSHFGVAVGAFVVGFVAANINDPMKNLDGVIENLCLTQETYPNLSITLLVVGKGKVKVNDNSLNIVYLNEIVSIEDKVFAYRAMDVLVNYSFAESWSLVSAEALSCGIPVVASKIGGVVDVIKDGQNGFLLNSEAEIAPILYSLFSDSLLAQRLGDSARQTAVTEFDIEMVLQLHYELYRQMVEV